MEIKSYTRNELKTFIDSDFYKNLEQIPISYHRAISHIQNPDVQDDDELLWAAYENEKLIGYVGVLPNYIAENQERKKIYWLSCFWVDENYRKENVASLLFFPLIKKYGKHLIVSNFLPNLEKMYQNIGIFQP
ncbi:MAG: GNAT family N-acetyltransferase, partial [Firmicutes bacterium]|nr:GNAT family N-acetyltransferase [Bacillota bacterium]